MIPLALRVTNFRSVRGTQSFSFPQEPGLYFMRGVNEVEDRLEANGAGKSTLWEALTWCWFGKTSRGLKAGDVCNWDAGKGAEVEFDFYFANEEACIWTMKRTWSPNSWTLSHIAEFVTDESVIDLTKEKDNLALSWLALDFDQWLNCVFNAQNQPMFLDMKREAQASFFSAIVGADVWLERSSRASKLAQDKDKELRELERELSNLEGRIAATDAHDWTAESKQWEKNRNSDLVELETQHSALLERRKAAKAALQLSKENETRARQKLADAHPDSDLRIEYQSAQERARNTERELGKEEGIRVALHASMQKLEDDKDCPLCGTRMDREHRRQELRKMETNLRATNAIIDQLKRSLAKANEEADTAARKLEAQGDFLNEARSNLDSIQRGVAGWGREIDSIDRELDVIEERHEHLKAARNPYADKQERAADEARRMRDDADWLRKRIDMADERMRLFQFWVRGFKDIRLSKIDDALTELEVEVNSSVDALGLLGWELQFQVDRETKAGTVQRGFNCFVQSPANDRQVPWEAWSGGESQRLRLAGTMGLADLVRSRTGATIPLEVWDEPTQGLSPQGIRDLLECLAERARREQRVIYLVDHRSHDFGGFAGGVTIRKTAKGTIIENGAAK